jgi:serine/threonine protein kinase
MAKVAAEVGSTANSYQILAKLAAGGMAEIFLARGASSASVERYCVLKRILRERANDAQFVQMFLDEARLAAQLQHPNIASVYDIGMLGESYFFTMEYVHGETVRSLLQRAHERHRALPLACVLTIIAGAAAGLHHAHERNANDGQPLGIVHRDVSPSNLMVSFEGNTKLVDFGVAKAANRSVETKSGTVKGKISYLSPEQCRGVRVDRRSDLFSLGIVMWEMLTGKRLYRRASDFDNMTAIVQEPAPRPTLHRPDVPRAVEDIVLRLLRKSVDDRFQSAAEVLEAVEDASLAAGTMLSTSAVSRLMRDLFGVRAEPWLALDAQARSPDPITLVSKPLPEELDDNGDPVERHFASVIDLSGALSFDEVADEGSDEGSDAVPDGAFGGVTQETAEESAVVAAPAAPGPAALPVMPSISLPTVPLRAMSPPVRTAAVAPVVALEAPPVPPPSAIPIPMVDLRSASGAKATLPGPMPVLAARSSADGTGASAHPAIAQVRALHAPPARHGPRALVMVIVGAAALGVAGTAYLTDRSSSATDQIASAPPAVQPTIQLAAQPAMRKVQEAPPVDALPDLAASKAPVDAAPVAEPMPVVAPAAPAVAPSRKPATPTIEAPPPPLAEPMPTRESVLKKFHDGQYDAVIHDCQRVVGREGFASVCGLAACKVHNVSEARRWLAAAAPKDSANFVKACEAAGTTLAPAHAPGPALDCVKNPMDCR